MRTNNLFVRSLAMGFVAAGALAFTACDNADNSVPGDDVVVVPHVPGIPSDDSATPNPEVLPEDINTVLPNFNYSVERENNFLVIRFDMTGVKDPYTNDWLRLYGPGDSRQNVWLSIDDVPKGFSIYNTIDDASDKDLSAVDLVFLVDNSGSMSQEANAIARDIIQWSNKLAQTLDVQFACVGYSEYGTINGGVDFTDANTLSDYLNRSSGTYRTMGYGGSNAADIEEAANEMNQNRVSDECGVMALKFADQTYNFRTGANRIYVNFTDEPNQPGGKEEYSTEWVKDLGNWPPTKGTIHTVYSASNNWSETLYYKEHPWNLSEYTGGTTLFANSYFTNVTLDDLPVTGALLNSYIIKFTNIEEIFDGQKHVVRITVKSTSENGTILADKTFEIIFEQ